jgi:hypothetical protein
VKVKLSHQEALTSFSEKVFDPKVADPDVGSVMHKISDRVDLASALNTVQHKDLPPSVAHLVQSTSEGKSGYDEESLEKARTALNSLVEKAWIELDDKIIKCKGFQEMNRENFAQVNRDIARLVEQITDMERVEAESTDGISSTDSEIKQTEELMNQEEQAYNAEFATNDAELTVRKNDLEVFQFILEFTKCDESSTTAFVQTSYQVCQTTSGRRTLLFKDQQLAKKFQTMLQPRSRRSLDSILSTVHVHRAPSFFQVSTPVVGEDGLPCAAEGMGDEDECMKSCSPDETPDCGLLHDKLSLMWGEFKDGVDDLTMEMAQNKDKWHELKDSLNGQIGLLTKKKARFNQLLAEARSNLASDRQEKKEKEKEKKTLDEEYVAYMKQCKRRIEWIMYQDMCAIKVVRNAIMETSTVCPTSAIVDCDVSAWVREECSVSCDDSCDPRKPFECGGWQEIKREVVMQSDQCGISCPTLSKYMRCGQYPCPVDCDMSEWSGWSACSADCEGGVQGRTRSVLVKPKNGGEQCNTPEESRACNTGSCDRDCRLARWTHWSPCSMACGGGLQQTRRHVLRPTRGDGKCPIASSRKRYRQRQCNTHKCEGDEVCMANQDLVVAIDGSGSLQQSGFDILKTYAETVVSRYQTKYYGRKRVKIGICQFGNGEVMADGKTISPAINVKPLTFSKSQVLDAVKGLEFKKGFTNMAQAFATAEDMFTQGSRKNAQQAVMVISDGKPSFSFETTGQVEQLDDKNIMRYFVVVNEDGMGSDAMAQIKSWASQPWETNIVHVPGLEQLSGDTQLWAQKAISKFCPRAYSPGQREKFEHANEMQKVYSRGVCTTSSGYPYSTWRYRGYWSGRRQARRKCKQAAVKAGQQIFMLSSKVYDKWWGITFCFTATMDVSPTLYDQWFQDKSDPECPGGSWRWSWLDTYAIYPRDEQVCQSMGIHVDGEDDCSGKDVWHYAGNKIEFDPDEWSKEGYDAWGGTGTCTSHVHTNGRTCKDHCTSFGKTCHRGQQSADDQARKLNYWLQGEGKSGTQCTADDQRHDSQTTEENGCLQKHDYQVCACK